MRSLRLAGALCALALAVPAAAQAVSPSLSAHYGRLYRQVAVKLGHRAPGRNIVKDGRSDGRATTDADLRRSIAVLERMLAPPPAPAPAPAVTSTATPLTTTSSAPAASYSGGGGYADVPGVPSSFAACVAERESTNGAGSSNIYGILGSGGQGSVAEQKAAFAQMYAARGTEPWAPYDGC